MFRRKRTFLETLRRWKQIDGEFEASLGYTGRACLRQSLPSRRPWVPSSTRQNQNKAPISENPCTSEIHPRLTALALGNQLPWEPRE
jgi:hypothetical protein